MKSVTSVPETNFQGIGRDMAERLGLGPEVRELKLGPTFTNNRSTAFHTLKYDFKPASVDVSKVARVDVGTNNTMTVTVPHLDGAGIPHTVFKGSQRPYHKECVLIIDRVTGEITLEKLTANIQVKKTRTEPKSQSHLGVSGGNSSNRPITPVETKRSPTHGRATGRTKVTSGKKREPSVQLHPKQYSPLRVSPYHGKSPPSTLTNSSPVQPSVAQSTLASLPMIGSDNDDCPLTSSGSFPTINSSAPSRSSPATNTQPAAKPSMTADSDEGALSDSTTSSSSSDSSDSDSDTENVPVLTGTNGHLNSTASSPTLLMPDNLLNDDLQLSESESDSN
ncbi:Ell-associated factor Eaf [Habropoda laboriosa]|uniref:Ell-associated factor Eaf n=1 Tax=Habropoda laboriosa TaxID=597456 RepID=A0A0L7QU72_9HYME|nr:PREDICTED: ell-associated factor Eaf [Habropoda laboriosa]XP_017793423.1 PREDICTED: ell-associated factor Eaf [Habropoda laboriosa]KOC62207.1 Ell-associated factor Eaf [Habropoda laboriosa]